MSQPEEPGLEQEKPAAAGRVRHDSSGRAVWEWAADTGRQALDSTSRLLKKLDLPGLTLADDDKKEDDDAPPPKTKPNTPTFGGSREVDPLASSKKNFNPYDNRTPPKRVQTPTSAPAKRPIATKPAAKPVPKPGFFARLFGRKS
jgi:hypothetical protein